MKQFWEKRNTNNPFLDGYLANMPLRRFRFYLQLRYQVTRIRSNYWGKE